MSAYETEPLDGGIYDSGRDEPFHLWRWDGQYWSKSAGWTRQGDAPKIMTRLTFGPVMRRASVEPMNLGAVVRDASMVPWVLVGPGRWVSSRGEASWSGIELPVVEDFGRVTK